MLVRVPLPDLPVNALLLGWPTNKRNPAEHDIMEKTQANFHAG